MTSSTKAAKSIIQLGAIIFTVITVTDQSLKARYLRYIHKN